MLKKILLLAGVVFSVAVFAAGTANNKKSAENKKSVKQPDEKIPDYSKGFELFHKMGLPNVSKAEYGKLNLYLNMPPGSGDSYFSRAQLGGNSWLLKKNSDDTMECLFNQAIEIKVIPQTVVQKKYQATVKKIQEKYKDLKDQQKLQEIMQRELTPLRNLIASNFTKANLKKDYETYLKSAETDDFRYYKERTYYALLFAVHLYDKGMKQEANKLAHIMFKKGGGRKKVLAGAVSILADCMYTSATYKFQQNKDWKEYAKAVSALNKRFSMVWTNKASVSKIAELLKDKVQGKIVLVSGKDITETDRKLVRKLVAKTTQTSIFSVINGNNIFPLPKTTDTQKNNPVEQIAQRGIKAIPLLCALQNNTTMINVMYYNLNSRISFQGREKQTSWKQFSLRPATLGDLADALLLRVIPIPDRGNELSLKDITNKARKFYLANKDKSQEELAVIYLKQGNEIQQSQAVEYLLTKKSEKYDKIIEDYMLANANSIRWNMVVNFVKRQKAKAKTFVKKYIQSCRKMVKEQEYGSEQHKKRMLKQYDKQEEMLLGLCSGMTAKTYLSEIVAGKKKLDRSSTEVLYTLFDGKNFAEQTKCILEAVLKAKDSKLKGELLNLIYLSKRFKKSTDNLSNKELWVKIFSDKTVLGPLTPNITVRRRAAYVFQDVFLKTDNNNRKINEDILSDDRYEHFIFKRINAFIADKKVPAWCNGKIAQEKLKELRKKILDTPETELKKTFSGISDNDLIAVARNLGPKDKLNRHLLEAANKIKKCSVKTDKLKLVSPVPELKGNLTSGKLSQLWNFFKKEQKAGNNIVCEVIREKCLGHVSIFITIAEKSKKGKASDILRSQISCSDINDVISIKQSANKTKKLPDAAASNDKLSEDEKLLNEAVAEMYHSDALKSKKEEIKLKQKLVQFCNEANAIEQGTIHFYKN